MAHDTLFPIRLSGQEALDVGLASNRQPELLIGDPPVWRAAHGLPQANRMLREDPQFIRLIANPRCLVEDILKVTLPTDTDLAAYLDGQASFVAEATTTAALNIIRSKLA